MRHFAFPQFEEVELIPICDLHIGSEAFDLNLIKNTLKYVRSKENAFIVLLGDVLNNTIVDSVGNSYQERMTPQEQLNYAIQLFADVRDRLLACVSGNHEFRSEKKAGIDLSYTLAMALNVPLYDRNIGVLDICVGSRGRSSLRRKNYEVVIYHGTGGGRLTGSKVNAAAKISEIIPDADVYLSGHGHFMTSVKDKVMLIDRHNKTLFERERWFITAPAYVEKEEYALRNLAHLSASGMVVVTLKNEENNSINVQQI